MKKIIIGIVTLFYCFNTYADIVPLRCRTCPQEAYNYQQLISSLKYLHIGTRNFGRDIIHPGLYVVTINIIVIFILLFITYKKRKYTLGKKS